LKLHPKERSVKKSINWINEHNRLPFILDRKVNWVISFLISHTLCLLLTYMCVYVYSQSQFPSSLLSPLCWYWISTYIGLNRPIRLIVIGWSPMSRIASLDRSWPLSVLQLTAGIELCLLLNHITVSGTGFDCAVIQLTSIEHIFQLFSGPLTAKSYLNTPILLPAFFSPSIA
jgi:hypothetical protein